MFYRQINETYLSTYDGEPTNIEKWVFSTMNLAEEAQVEAFCKEIDNLPRNIEDGASPMLWRMVTKQGTEYQFEKEWYFTPNHIGHDVLIAEFIDRHGIAPDHRYPSKNWKTTPVNPHAQTNPTSYRVSAVQTTTAGNPQTYIFPRATGSTGSIQTSEQETYPSPEKQAEILAEFHAKMLGNCKEVPREFSGVLDAILSEDEAIEDPDEIQPGDLVVDWNGRSMTVNRRLGFGRFKCVYFDRVEYVVREYSREDLRKIEFEGA